MDWTYYQPLPGTGLVLVRSIWRAGVELLPWKPHFEITHRRAGSLLAALDKIQAPKTNLSNLTRFKGKSQVD